MQVTESLSRKIKVLSFWAMISVLFIHSNTLGTFPEVASWNVFLQRLLTRSLSSWAVPFFFIVSGFWFANGNYDGWYSFLQKKVKTLLIPYICWAILGTIIVCPLIIFNNYVNGEPLLSRTFLGFPGIWQKINRLLGITIAGPCGNLALWYVRTLFIFFVFAPIWKWIYKRTPQVVLYGALSMVLFFSEYEIPFISVKAGSLSWLLIGMGLVNTKWILNKFNKRVAVLFGSLWVIVSTLIALDLWHIPLNINPILGCLCVWMVYDTIPSHSLPHWILNANFWVYCLHGCLMGYFLAGIPYVLGRTNVVTFSVMLLTPIMVFIICILLNKACSVLFPSVHKLLCGGRV